MKKLITLYTGLFLLVSASFGQKEEVNRPQALGISFFLTDFKTPEKIRNTSLNQVISDKSFASLSDMIPGLAVTYFKGLGNHLDLAASLGGSFINYPMPNKNFANDRLLLEATAQVNLKMTTEKYWVQPYITAGIGAHKYGNYYGAFLPLGLGLKVNFFDEAHLFITSTYRVPVTTETANYHLQHGIGIAGLIGGKKKEEGAIPTPPPPTDTDGDGLADINDKCPGERGMVRYGGCPVPDSDKDGLNDEMDKCASVAGLARYEGCPAPDTDKDGLNDEDDKCPGEFGVARYQGCPVPDKDKDGVNDEDDKCANLAGSLDNLGCPAVAADIQKKIMTAADNILFSSGSSKLNTKSVTALNEVAKIMNASPAYFLEIESVADNQAVAIKNYLTSKGVKQNRIRTMVVGSSAGEKTRLILNYY